MSHLNCPECEQETALVLSGADLTCPKCAGKFNSMVKTAQFGGNATFAPGSSPLSGGHYPSRPGGDEGLDAIMGRTRFREQSEQLADPRMSIEKMLEAQHTYAEEDAIPYNLTPKERKDLKIKQELQRRRRYYEAAANSIKENSVEFIKNNFHPTKQQMQTLEQSLADRHLNKNKKHEREDVNPEPIKPERTHDVYSSVRKAEPIVNHSTNTIFGPHDDSEEPEGSNVWDRRRLDQSYDGNATTLKSQADLERYLDTLGGMDWGASPQSAFNVDGPNVPNLMDAVSSEEARYHQVEHTEPLESPINSAPQDTSVSTEAKLRNQNWQKSPAGLPSELTKGFNWDDWGSNEENKWLGPDTSFRTPAMPKI